MDEIKRNSWHFRLYDGYSNGCVWDLTHGRVNFCKYSRKVVQGFFGACGITLLLAWFASGALQTAGTLGLWMFTDNVLQSFIGVFPIIEGQGTLLDFCGIAAWIATAIVVVVGVIGLCCAAADEYVAWKADHPTIVTYQPPKEIGFFRTWYRSWKDKYCPIMKLEEKKEQEGWERE